MDPPFTLPFERFWAWLMTHPNCILRAGTPEAVLFDDDDLHWHFASEDERTLLVQLLRGKRLLGEIVVDPEQVAYVEGAPPEQPDEHVFELISETENDRFAAWVFVLTHGWDEDGDFTAGRVH